MTNLDTHYILIILVRSTPHFFKKKIVAGGYGFFPTVFHGHQIALWQNSDEEVSLTISSPF